MSRFYKAVTLCGIVAMLACIGQTIYTAFRPEKQKAEGILLGLPEARADRIQAGTWPTNLEEYEFINGYKPDVGYSGCRLRGICNGTAQKDTLFGDGYPAADTTFRMGCGIAGGSADSVCYGMWHADISALPANFSVEYAELRLFSDSLGANSARSFPATVSASFKMCRVMLPWGFGGANDHPGVSWNNRKRLNAVADTTWGTAGLMDISATINGFPDGSGAALTLYSAAFTVKADVGHWPMRYGYIYPTGADTVLDYQNLASANPADRDSLGFVTVNYKIVTQRQPDIMRIPCTDMVRKWHMGQWANWGAAIIPVTRALNNSFYVCTDKAKVWYHRPQLCVWGRSIELVGSCCNTTNGTCSVTRQADCTGTWTVNGVCTPNTCTQPTGSCCAADGSCTVTTYSNCAVYWTSAGVCSPNPCPSGGVKRHIVEF